VSALTTIRQHCRGMCSVCVTYEFEHMSVVSYMYFQTSHSPLPSSVVTYLGAAVWPAVQRMGLCLRFLFT
jgi:hypothetical protein